MAKTSKIEGGEVPLDPPKASISKKRLEFNEVRAKENQEIVDSVIGFEVALAESNIIDDIRKHTLLARDAMESDPIRLRVLANTQVELSILLQRLSDRIALAGYNERAAEYQLKVTQEKFKVMLVEEGNAIGVSDSRKVVETKEEYETWNHARYLLDSVNLARKSTDKTIDTIRSKLSYEKKLEEHIQ